MMGALEFVAMEVQPAEERAVAATKLLQSSDAGRQQRTWVLLEGVPKPSCWLHQACRSAF